MGCHRRIERANCAGMRRSPIPSRIGRHSAAVLWAINGWIRRTTDSLMSDLRWISDPDFEGH